ncbi:MAG: hypothetical protein II565_08420, partial [Fibrobacter sp.]|nr:hypothetical protein [Fibrobacter sp.]
IPTIQERRVKMNRIHCVLLTILSVAGLTFATGGSKAVGKFLEDGYYGMANMETVNSPDGIYFYVDNGWDEPCLESPRHLRLYIGNNLDGEQNENIWILTDQTKANVEPLNSELKKGNSLTLDKFTKLEFNESHNRYLLDATDRRGDIEFKWDEIPEDSVITELTPENYFTVLVYILYQKDDSKTALCGYIGYQRCSYKIECFYRDDNSLVFDSLPNPDQRAGGYQGCSVITCPSSLYTNYTIDKRNNFDFPLYKVNGIPATKNSSNIVIQNKKQPKLKLKGNR